MKRLILISLIAVVALMFGTTAMAQLPAPTGLVCSLADTDSDLVNDSVCCNWDDVSGAAKYSVDIEIPVDTTDPKDGIADMVVELSFGTSDRTDGRLMADSDLCIALTDLAYDINSDGLIEQISGDADIKVKALDPGKGKGSQNNPFSYPPVTVTLP